MIYIFAKSLDNIIDIFKLIINQLVSLAIIFYLLCIFKYSPLEIILFIKLQNLLNTIYIYAY